MLSSSVIDSFLGIILHDCNFLLTFYFVLYLLYFYNIHLLVNFVHFAIKCLYVFFVFLIL